MTGGPDIERPEEPSERRWREAMARIRELRREPLPLLDAARLMREVREEFDRAAGDVPAPPGE
jgi:hypothetical protein